MVFDTKKSKILLIALGVLFIFSNFVFAQITYYSQGTGNFGTLSNWNTVRGGGGSSPADLVSGDIFTVQNGHTITMNNVSNLIQDLVIESGGTFDNSSNTITFAVGGGFLDIQSGGTYTASTGTIEHNAGVLSTVTIRATAATSLYNVTTNGRLTFDGVTFTIDGTFSFRANQNITLANGGSVAYGSTGILDYDFSGSKTIADEWPDGTTVPNVQLNSGTVTIPTATTRTVGVSLTRSGGSITATGTLQYNSGATLSYNSSTTTTIGDEWPASNAPQNVEMTLTGGSTLQSTGDFSRTIAEDLTINVGTLDLNAGVLTVSGSVTGSLISGSATIDPATTLFLGNGAGTNQNQEISGTLTLTLMEIDKSGGPGNTVTMISSAALNFAGTSSLTITNGTLDLNGTGRFTASPTTLTVSAGATLRTGGTSLSSVGTLSLASTSTVDFSGSNAETISTGTYGNMTISNSNSTGATLGGAVTVNGALTVNATRRLNLDGQTITKGGSSSLTVNGTLYTDGSAITGFNSYSFSGTVRFNGDGTGSETAPAATYNNLRINNADGLTLAGNVTVNGVLTFTNGKVTSTSSNLLTLGVSATATPTSTSFVTGPVARATNGSITSFSFPIGISNSLRSVTLSFDSAPATSNTITAEANGTATGATSSDPDVKSVEDDGYWTITSTEVSPPSYTGTFTTTNFSPSIDASSNVTVVKGTTPNFNTQGTSESSASNQVTASFSDGFSDFAIGNLAVVFVWDGSTNNNWSEGTNWDQGTAPGNGDVVSIPTASTVLYDASVSTTNYASVTLSGSATLSLDGAIFNFSGTTFVLGATGTLTFNGATVQNYNGTNTTYPSGSTVQYNSGSTVYADTYGNLTVNTSAAISSTGAVVVNGTLTKSAAGTYTASSTLDVNGNVALNAGTVIPSGGATVSGDISSSGGNFSASSGTVTLDGSSQQTFSGGTALTLNNLTLNNTGGLSLSQAASIAGTLTFSSDALITTGSNNLTIGVSGTVSGANSARYVNGRVRKVWAASTSGASFAFPVGKGGQYLPVTLSNITVNAAGTYDRTVEQFNSDATTVDPDIDGTTLSAVSAVRYFEVANNTGAGSLTAAPTITLSWNSNDGVDGPLTALDVAQLATSGPASGSWTSKGGDGSGTASSGTITSAGITTGGIYYALGDDAAGGQDNSLPVELMAFEANADFDQVVLSWKTASELENLGFNIYRQKAESADWTIVNEQMIQGQGTYSGETDYTYVDKQITAGESYRYKLESISYNGVINVEKVVELTIPLPDEFVLFNNYPNPFNPTTNIKFLIPEYSTVSLTIYDATGKEVKKLINQQDYNAGSYVTTWDATNSLGINVTSGIYFYRFTAGKFSKMGRMVLLK